MADSERLGLISWIVLLAVVVIPPAFGSAFTQFEFLKESLLYLFTGMALVGWGVSVLRERKVSMTAWRLSAVFVAFAAFALVAVLWAPSQPLALVSSANWLAAMAIFLVVTAPGGRPIRFKTFSFAVAIGALLTGAIGLLDAAGLGLTTTVWDPPGFPGAFDAREFAVGYYAVALPILAAGVFRAVDVPRRIAAGAALVVGAAHFGLCATPATIGIVGGIALLAAVAMGALQGFSRVSLAFGPIGALAAALVLAAGLSFGGPTVGPSNDATKLPWIAEMQPRPLADQTDIRDPRFAVPRIEEVPNWAARSYLVGIAFDMFREQPVIGYGPGGWWGTQSKFPRPDDSFVKKLHERYPAFRAPHNGYALIMTELGGVGLLLFLVWLSALFGLTLTALAHRSEPENWLIEHFGLVAAVAAGLGVAVFTPALQLSASVVILFAAAGLLVRESAALNEFKGMSSVWTINQAGGRWDTNFFCGVLPVVLGLTLVSVGGVWAVTSYFRSWGDLSMLRTQFKLAEDKYSLADEIIGGDGEVLFNLALAKKRTGRTQDAAEDLNRAAELRPYDVRIINMVAELHLHKHEYSECVTAARRAVALFPNYLEGRRMLATGLDLQGRMTDAAAELTELLKRDPPDSLKGQVHRELGEYYEGPLSNPAKAIEHYELALQLLDQSFLKDQVQTKLGELRKEEQRLRLEREGKPIPKGLLPDAPEHMGHAPDGPH